MAKVGRKSVLALLPSIRKEYSVDFVIANVENAAHGRGVNEVMLDDFINAGVDVFTMGNDQWRNPKVPKILAADNYKLIRPANETIFTDGKGEIIAEVGGKRVLVINLLGQTFLDKYAASNPFQKVDEILASHEGEDIFAVFVDFHAEATSEKVAMGWYLDGRVSLLAGTHTHVPTADETILPQGTAYVTDVGMCGAVDSVIGPKKEIIIDRFVHGKRLMFEFAESGLAYFRAVLVEHDENGKTVSIERIDREVEVE